MAERQFRFTLTGISPLLMHWDNIEWADEVQEMRTQIKQKNKAEFAAGDDRCPPDTWKGCLYNDGKIVAVPTDNLRTCLMKAGAKITYKNKETYKKVVPSTILFLDLYAEFRYSGKPLEIGAVNAIKGAFPQHLAAVRKLGFDLLVKRAKIGQSKHVRVRPMFRDWTVSGEGLVADDSLISCTGTDSRLAEIWRIAGMRIGLCDWRPDAPQSPGPYGRFTVAIEA